MADETCYGCGAEPMPGPPVADPPVHPWVAVINKADVDAARVESALHMAEGGVFIALPVCVSCHTDPAHRQRPIKAHFHERKRLRRATEMAGSDTIGG